MDMSLERIQKILAQAGIASRRKAEELIVEGLVTVNGRVAKLGDKAEWGKDAIKVKGKLLHQMDAPVYLAFYKPKNIISMLADPQERPTLADYLTKIQARVYPVGRLDFTSEGLILLTNDGSFAEKLQKREDVLRVYTVKVKGHPDKEMFARLNRVMRTPRTKGKVFKPYSIRMTEELANKTLIEVVVRGGGAFDVRSFFEERGYLVERITRTAIGHITLKGLKPGHFRFLKASQVLALLEQPELGQRRWENEVEDSRPILPKERSKEEIKAEKKTTRKVVLPLSQPVRNERTIKTDRPTTDRQRRPFRSSRS